MKRKLLSLTAALACCVLLAAAIIYMKHSDGKDSEPDLPQQEQEQSSSQSFHSSDMIASREDIKTVTVTSGSESFTVVAGQNGADPHIRELEGIRQNVQLENALLALCKSISPEKLVEENAGDLKKYGLDKPLLVRFFLYMKNMLTGDLGVSYAINKNFPISEMIKGRLGISLAVGAMAMIFGTIMGLILGIVWTTCSRILRSGKNPPSPLRMRRVRPRTRILSTTGLSSGRPAPTSS